MWYNADRESEGDAEEEEEEADAVEATAPSTTRRSVASENASFAALVEARGRRDLLLEWNHPIDPPEAFSVTNDLHTPVPWKCRACGGRWVTSLQHRLRSQDRGDCPHCSAPHM